MDELELMVFDRTYVRMLLERKIIVARCRNAKDLKESHVALNELMAFEDAWAKKIVSKIDSIYVTAAPDMFADVEELTYRQTWARMPESHRMVKLKQYVSRLGYSGRDITDKVYQVVDILKRKKLRVKDIIYDQNEMIITKIDNLPKGLLKKQTTSRS